MVYPHPCNVTFGELKETLAMGYGVVFTLRTINPGESSEFTAVHCKRTVGTDILEYNCENHPDDYQLGWFFIFSLCRRLRIDPERDGLFGFYPASDS